MASTAKKGKVANESNEVMVGWGNLGITEQYYVKQ